MTTESEPWVDLYWLPLGAGGHSVRLNGRVFEAVAARLERRSPCDLYHSALVVRVPEGRFVRRVRLMSDRGESSADLCQCLSNGLAHIRFPPLERPQERALSLGEGPNAHSISSRAHARAREGRYPPPWTRRSRWGLVGAGTLSAPR